MALTLRIENEVSLPDGGPLSIHVSGRRGIDIGRDPHLDWTLPDQTRYISSKHCEVRWQDGDYVLYDVSKNGTFINGSDRRVQGPHRLRNGDRLLIGNYIVVAEVDGEGGAGQRLPAPAEGATDFWRGDGAAPPGNPADFVVRQPRPVQPDFLDWAVDVPEVRRGPQPGGPGADPFAAPARSPVPGFGPGEDPFAPAAGNGRAASPFDTPAPHDSGAGGFGWDTPSAGTPGVSSAGFGGADPFGVPAPGPSAAPAPAPKPRPVMTPRPKPTVDAPAEAPAQPFADAGGSDPAGPKAWDESSAAVTDLNSEFSSEVKAAARKAQARNTPPPPRNDAPPPQQASAFGVAERADAAHPASQSELLAAFARGAGLAPDAYERRNPVEFMEDLGAMMRIVVENMMGLLHARTETKRSMRSSEHTMIGATDNNPLKFSPTPEDAMRILFGPQLRSYLGGRKAFAKSFEDLNSHQLRTFAAMQQAMKMLFEDLDPASIEKAVEGSLIGSRKGRQWDQFVARWQAKTLRSEDGMVGLFMLYFAECYDRLGSGKRDGG